MSTPTTTVGGNTMQKKHNYPMVEDEAGNTHYLDKYNPVATCLCGLPADATLDLGYDLLNPVECMACYEELTNRVLGTSDPAMRPVLHAVHAQRTAPNSVEQMQEIALREDAASPAHQQLLAYEADQYDPRDAAEVYYGLGELDGGC